MTTSTPSREAIDVETAPRAEDLVTTPAPVFLRSEKHLAKLEDGVRHYPEPIRTAMSWVIGFFLDHCHGNFESLREIGDKVAPNLSRSTSYWSNLINGQNFQARYPSGIWKQDGVAWKQFHEIVAGLRRYAQDAERVGRLPFVPTGTYRAIAQHITAGRALSSVIKFVAITGATGSQKSASFKEYRRLNNHGAVVHLEAPARPTLAALQRKIADQYHVGAFSKRIAAAREEVIRDNLNESRTIIIDNVQRLYDPRRGGDQPAFNWLLEVQDDTGCTIVLSFTTDFVDTLSAGRAKGYFEQFVGRIGGLNTVLRLPQWTPEGDLREIARAFRLDAGKGAMEYLQTWSRQAGRVRIVFGRLQRAQEFARLDGRDRITLADLAEADSYVPPTAGDDEDGGAE